MHPELPLTDRQYKDFDAFVAKFDASARMVMGTGGAPLRFAWVGSSPQRWVCVSWSEAGLDERVLEAFYARGPTSFPWAHAAEALAHLAQEALEARPGLAFSNLRLRDGAGGMGRRNVFSARRARNFSAYFATAGDTVERAAWALLSEMPGSWAYSSQGAGSSFATPPPARVGGLSKLLPPMEYFNHEDARRYPDPEVQVDGDGRVFALWIPAAARALGAPASLSVSTLGLHSLMGLGDIIGAANRVAQDDPAGFRIQFAAALAEIDPTDAAFSGRILGAIASNSSLIRSFVDLDRRAVIEEAVGAVALSAKGPRL